MSDSNIKYFEILKKEVAKTLQQSYSVDNKIENWKRQEILYLQEDLENKINGRISEKWFYTHIKTNSGKLPRIDMLNILCEYAGYQNWNELTSSFKINNEPSKVKLKSSKRIISLLLAGLIILIAIVGYQLYPKKSIYKFCFIDANLKAPIKDSPIWVVKINKDESPFITKCDSNGCFKFETHEERIQFIVRSPYYKTDTITRILHNKSVNEEQIQLKTNDYALMIHMFSKSKVTNWRKRRKQLSNMLTEDVRIYQVYDDGVTGMELYNKKEFIDKLTTPLKSLKNIEIIETIYTGDKISIMRFKQNEKEDE